MATPMNLKITIIAFILFLLSVAHHTLNAQCRCEMGGVGIRASYYGSLIHPGAMIGLEVPYKSKRVDKGRGRSTKSFFRERYYSINTGFYHHEDFHTNAFLIGELQFRRQKAGGMFVEFAPGLGLSRTFLDGPAYHVNDKGNIDRIPAAGYFYGLFSLSYGMGYNFSLHSDLPVKTYFRTGAIVMAPYNTLFYFRPIVELGVIFRIS